MQLAIWINPEERVDLLFENWEIRADNELTSLPKFRIWILFSFPLTSGWPLAHHAQKVPSTFRVDYCVLSPFWACSYNQHISRGAPCGGCCHLPWDTFFSFSFFFSLLWRSGQERYLCESWEHWRTSADIYEIRVTFVSANQQGKQLAIMLINETIRKMYQLA